ncbi:hypothetical protein F5J12DRAFT_889556 [Pisolithus orientalis]|uniref:uncharacterized protein n=1 Tax=Pisolithus orientalis TaxID=936130 RepID=UPI0022241CF3|nr:uncharacterized protein F5J12DRAFT_889556 [Pisolithus orientalis]KAI6025672.1 hypothetical protein F5J12DRAFT_889556 [Pisolithus orientalis]
MQAYSINDMRPVFSMEAQAVASLTGVLKCTRRLTRAVPQPEEMLEIIYKWVDKWDADATIYLWWKYVDNHEIAMPDLDGHCLQELTEQSAFKNNLFIVGAIVITDLWQPEGQRQFLVEDVFKDYQERVKEWVHLEAERLAINKVDKLERNQGDNPPNPGPSRGVLENCANDAGRQNKSVAGLRVGRKWKNSGNGGMMAGPLHKQTKSITVTTTNVPPPATASPAMTAPPVPTGLKLQILAHRPPPTCNSKPSPDPSTPLPDDPTPSHDLPPLPMPCPPLFFPSATPTP